MKVEALNCPNCGAGVESDRTVCQFCKTRLKTVGCTKCFGLMFEGSRFCGHCGAIAAPVEVKLEADAGECPRCRTSLEHLQINDAVLRGCTKCDGVWMDTETFENVCADRERQSAVLGYYKGRSTIPDTKTKVAYVPCPDCGQLMNRNNFARASRRDRRYLQTARRLVRCRRVAGHNRFYYQRRNGSSSPARKNEIQDERARLRDEAREQLRQDQRYGTGNLFARTETDGIRGFIRNLFE